VTGAGTRSQLERGRDNSGCVVYAVQVNGSDDSVLAGSSSVATIDEFSRRASNRLPRERRLPYTSLTFFSGRLRTGLPVAAKMAFITAGFTTQIVGSPTPPQKS